MRLTGSPALIDANKGVLSDIFGLDPIADHEVQGASELLVLGVKEVAEFLTVPLAHTTHDPILGQLHTT